jgi:hypothetical protein
MLAIHKFSDIDSPADISLQAADLPPDNRSGLTINGQKLLVREVQTTHQ